MASAFFSAASRVASAASSFASAAFSRWSRIASAAASLLAAFTSPAARTSSAFASIVSALASMTSSRACSWSDLHAVEMRANAEAVITRAMELIFILVGGVSGEPADESLQETCQPTFAKIHGDIGTSNHPLCLAPVHSARLMAAIANKNPPSCAIHAELSPLPALPVLILGSTAEMIVGIARPKRLGRWCYGTHSRKLAHHLHA